MMWLVSLVCQLITCISCVSNAFSQVITCTKTSAGRSLQSRFILKLVSISTFLVLSYLYPYSKFKIHFYTWPWGNEIFHKNFTWEVVHNRLELRTFLRIMMIAWDDYELFSLWNIHRNILESPWKTWTNYKLPSLWNLYEIFLSPQYHI